MTYTLTTPLLANVPLLHGNLKAIQFLPRHCSVRILLDPTHCPWYPLYPLLGFYLTGTVAADAETAKNCLYGMDRESHILLSEANENQFQELLPFTHLLACDSLSLYERYGPQALEHSIPCALTIRPDQPPFSLPGGITGLRLKLSHPEDLDELESALNKLEQDWAAELLFLRRLHIGGPFPLLRPDFDLFRLVSLLNDFHSHHNLVLELTVGESLFGGVFAPLSEDPGFPFPEGKPHLYQGTEKEPIPFLHF